MLWLRTTLLLAALCGGVALVSGCASRQPQPTTIESRASSDETNAALTDDKSLADRLGEGGVVLLVVAVAIGGIVLPLIFL
jgi:hypothetical protein